MASAAEAQQLVVVATALQQRDFGSLARLTRAASSAAVCEAGCMALAHAAEECSPTLEETQRGVEALACALRAHPANAGVQRQACRGLVFLSKTHSQACVVAGACGVVKAVVTALQTHAENAVVLEAAFHALAKLTSSFPDNCSLAHRCGGLQALLNVLRAQSMHIGVQNGGCMALGQMCILVASLRVESVRLGAPAIVINALRSFPDSSMLQDNGLYALTAMLPDALTVHNDDVRYPGVVACVTHALEAHVGNADVQHGACGALFKLTANQPAYIAEALRFGVFPLLVKTLNRGS